MKFHLSAVGMQEITAGGWLDPVKEKIREEAKAQIWVELEALWEIICEVSYGLALFGIAGCILGAIAGWQQAKKYGWTVAIIYIIVRAVLRLT